MMAERQVALVTGGAGGIGAATARALLDRGYLVAVTGRRPERLEAFAARAGAGDTLLTLTGDAADADDVAASVAQTLERFGRLDVAIANAGYATFDDIADGDPHRWRDMVLTNVLGPALLINAALPELRRTKGRIVLVGSVAGLTYTPGNVYGATKWAVTALAENTRRLVSGEGVGVTLIGPGRVDTDFWEAAGGPQPGRLLTADQVAAAITWAVTQPEGVDVSCVLLRPFGAVY